MAKIVESPSILKKIQSHWGMIILMVLSLLGLVRLLLQTMPGHYRIFTGAAVALWSGIDPYGTDFNTGVGYWFYSPTCGMFFYSLFAYLPEKIGMSAYMILSWFVFVLGVLRFTRVVNAPKSILNWFWLGIAPQMMTSFLASKLETLMTGILFFLGASLVEYAKEALNVPLFQATQSNRDFSKLSNGFFYNRRYPGVMLMTFLSAMILIWKFQPFPTLGLLIIVWLYLERSFWFPLLLVVGSAFWAGLPFLFKPSAFILGVYHHWNESMASFLKESFGHYDNLYPLIQSMGFHLTAGSVQVISFFGVILFAHWIFFVVTRRDLSSMREDQAPSEKTSQLFAWEEGVTLSLAYGALYSLDFSPMSQNNSYILYSPIWLLALLLARKIKWMKITAFALFLVMTFAYSDVVPEATRLLFRQYSVKPFACFLFGILAAIAIYQEKKKFSPLFSEPKSEPLALKL